MTKCETYMLCQSNDPLKFNSSGCWKYVIFPLYIMKKGVGGTDIINWVEVANAGTCRPGGATVSHMFHQMSSCSYEKKMEEGRNNSETRKQCMDVNNIHLNKWNNKQ